MILISNVQIDFHYLFDFKVILGPDINKLSDHLLSMWRNLSEIKLYLLKQTGFR